MLLRGRGTNYPSIVATRSLNTAQSQNDEPTALLVGSGCFLQCCLTLHRFIAKPFRLLSPALELQSSGQWPQGLRLDKCVVHLHVLMVRTCAPANCMQVAIAGALDPRRIGDRRCSEDTQSG